MVDISKCNYLKISRIHFRKMSWASMEWKNELPSRALQKVEELEQQLEKLKKERQQKQCQMDTLEQVKSFKWLQLQMLDFENSILIDHVYHYQNL